MSTSKNNSQSIESVGPDFFDKLWNESWTYIKTVVDVVREPVLILDKEFRVMSANETFYKTFKVEPKDTEDKLIYDLGNGQWDIQALRKLLEDILPKHTFFKGFEVIHEFPVIGRKIMILNARQIFFKSDEICSRVYPPIILLAIEDVTEMMDVAEMLTNHTNQFEMKMADRTEKMEENILRLEKEIGSLRANNKKEI
jgi:PAS domain-containing protein